MQSFTGRLKGLFGAGRPEFPKDELAALLYGADFSAPIVERLMQSASKAKPRDKENVIAALSTEVASILKEVSRPIPNLSPPAAVLLLGVNGAGKTTFAAKLAGRFKNEGKNVVLAAADTFRAGAVEQLKTWGDRLGVEVVAQASGADPGAVVFDAWQKAVAANSILIADTAGRLHTKQPLVEELKKIVRILGKDGRGAPQECFLVLDGTTGQNALAQSREFIKAAPLTGLVLTKMDGTARGGAAVSCSLELSLPIRYLGVGEKVEDIVPFEPEGFAQELFKE